MDIQIRKRELREGWIDSDAMPVASRRILLRKQASTIPLTLTPRQGLSSSCGPRSVRCVHVQEAIEVSEVTAVEYTIGELGKLAGVSTRTLRHYDKIGLLKPARTSPSGYRLYGPAEVDRLQQILFYRELGFELERIKAIVSAPDFDGASALKEHLASLVAKRSQLDTLIANVEKSIEAVEGKRIMADQEKFEGFKRSLIEENEKRFGKEVRERYGDEAVERSNAKLMGMSKEEYERGEALAAQIHETLRAAMETGDPAGELAQKAADLHRQWLTLYWDSYSKEAHAGLAQMYVDDERFKAYYDKDQPGTAEFLRDAILVYTSR